MHCPNAQRNSTVKLYYKSNHKLIINANGYLPENLQEHQFLQPPPERYHQTSLHKLSDL